MSNFKDHRIQINIFLPLKKEDTQHKKCDELEEKLNKVFSVYAKAYYSNTTISSCYVWELGDKIEDGIALAVLFKNDISFQKEVESGTWDSCNFITINFARNAEGLQGCI